MNPLVAELVAYVSELNDFVSITRNGPGVDSRTAYVDMEKTLGWIESAKNRLLDDVHDSWTTGTDAKLQPTDLPALTLLSAFLWHVRESITDERARAVLATARDHISALVDYARAE